MPNVCAACTAPTVEADYVLLSPDPVCFRPAAFDKAKLPQRMRRILELSVCASRREKKIGRAEWQQLRCTPRGRSIFFRRATPKTTHLGVSLKPTTLLRKSILSAAAIFALTNCAGAAGSDGKNGTNGSNGTNGTNGTNGLTARLNVAPEAAGSNCAQGGTRIDSGLDANANGTLDTSEIGATQFVCNGARGDAGANGANGTNGMDGTNGTNGTNGVDGFSVLVVMGTEPTGSHCAAGGIKVDAGADTNRNGSLDVSEISSTAYVCTGLNGPRPSCAGSTMRRPSGGTDSTATARPSSRKRARFWPGLPPRRH